MATYQTYQTVGLTEDVSDIITNIDPEKTPFYSNAAKKNGIATNYEWQTQDLDTAEENNAVEGADAVDGVVTPTVMLNNYQNISEKTYKVSGTNNAVQAYGRGPNEIDYVRAEKGKALMRDIEVTLLSNTPKDAGSASTPRILGGIQTWITNVSVGTGGSAPTGDGTDSVVQGTPRAFTLEQLEEANLQASEAGGEPDILMMSPKQKVNFSKFGGIAENRYPLREGQEGAIIGSVEYWLSDFGRLDVVVNKQMEKNQALLIDSDHYAVVELRPVQTEVLAKTGDNVKEQMLCEYTLEMSAPNAHAAVYGLN